MTFQGGNPLAFTSRHGGGTGAGGGGRSDVARGQEHDGLLRRDPPQARLSQEPYQAQVWRGGNMVSLGSFATAEEAAPCVARSPGGAGGGEEAGAAVEIQGTLRRSR